MLWASDDQEARQCSASPLPPLEFGSLLTLGSTDVSLREGSGELTGLFVCVASYSIYLCSKERQHKNLLGRGTMRSVACTGNWKSETWDRPPTPLTHA